ncbi:DUF3560 domain-containing protein [Aciditerrimonas ferrireducens]|uniref:DUF3560 domain-containing protein n=1 Tax=Aciditerrimonas ferrireducens TaxID=667306 RepID=A0ABV6C278_9ACTN
MATYRQRQAARAERLREWAERREERARVVLEDPDPRWRDWAFITQPGRIRERERLAARERGAFESLAKAEAMRRRAEGIEAAARAAIYRDDPDATERLRERIAALDAERARVKAFNESCRRGEPDWSLLTEQEAEALRTTDRVMPSQTRDREGRLRGFPAYHLRNLASNLARQRQRLAELEQRAGE